MNYQKKPLSILEQIDKLQRRGLIVEDVGMAYNYLSNISYYRFGSNGIIISDKTFDI